MDSIDTPVTVILFGATGDLVSRKVLPSLYSLYEDGRLPEHFRVVAFTRRELTTQEYCVEFVEASLLKKNPNIDREKMARFCALFEYVQGDYAKVDDYIRLESILSEFDEVARMPVNRLFYMAIYPNLFIVKWRY